MVNHICTPETCPEPSHYYVSAIDAGRNYLMAGPYDTHRKALERVPAVSWLANKLDRSGRAWFIAWGTCRITQAPFPEGKLNAALLGPEITIAPKVTAEQFLSDHIVNAGKVL